MLAAFVGRRAAPAPSSDIPLRGVPPLPTAAQGDPPFRFAATTHRNPSSLQRSRRPNRSIALARGLRYDAFAGSRSEGGVPGANHLSPDAAEQRTGEASEHRSRSTTER